MELTLKVERTLTKVPCLFSQNSKLFSVPKMNIKRGRMTRSSRDQDLFFRIPLSILRLLQRELAASGAVVRCANFELHARALPLRRSRSKRKVSQATVKFCSESNCTLL
jgi:hypothetical protein